MALGKPDAGKPHVRFDEGRGVSYGTMTTPVFSPIGSHPPTLLIPRRPCERGNATSRDLSPATKAAMLLGVPPSPQSDGPPDTASRVRA